MNPGPIIGKVSQDEATGLEAPKHFFFSLSSFVSTPFFSPLFPGPSSCLMWKEVRWCGKRAGGQDLLVGTWVKKGCVCGYGSYQS